MDRKPLDLHTKGKNLKVRGARLYSDIFSPPSVYAAFALILALDLYPILTGLLHSALFGILTSLLPMVYILLKIRSKQLHDIHLSEPGQRTAPYLLGASGAAVSYLILRSIGSNPVFLGFIITVVIGLLSLALINTSWMISAHTASITAVVAVTWVTFGLILALSISPLIISTGLIRYYLKRHSFLEIFSGALLGALIVSLVVVLGLFKL